jgi:PilZ domain
MKRRKGKRRQDAKAAAQVKFSGEIEKPASHVEIPADTEGPAGGSTAIAGADRRAHPRYEFTAAVDLVSTASGARIETRVRDLSQQGCYVDTDSPFPLQTVADVRITKKAQSFEARARVVYSQISKGMGLVFTAVKPEQLVTLEAWVAESRETSWLASNRRRSQRVLMKIPVRVSGQNALGPPFEEEVQTLAVSAHGALIPISTQVSKGQRLTLMNVQTKAALECVVAHIRKGDPVQVGVEFMLPNPTFWHVAFPPKDWTPQHPDAKSPVKGSE